MAWSPDGTELAYTLQTGGAHDIWVLTMGEAVAGGEEAQVRRVLLDRRGQRTEGDQRDRALIGALRTRDDERALVRQIVRRGALIFLAGLLLTAGSQRNLQVIIKADKSPVPSRIIG